MEEENQEVILFGAQIELSAEDIVWPWYQRRTRALGDPLLRMHN